MLDDRATVDVEGGRGGDGCVSFRREAHVPKGGPDGGDGGDGGDVVVVCDPGLRDLAFLRRHPHARGGRGAHGEGGNRRGADGRTVELRVPPGTVVSDRAGDFRFDLVNAGDRAIIARGGGGGRGNARFRGPTRQAPSFAERGLAGEAWRVEFRLKLMADVGLVGLPNAGKSSLIAAMSRARPKVADYPFTTLEPALGTVELDDRQLVVADVPGLIEGASLGAGLGHEFLAHLERTRLLVHVVDVAPIDGSDPRENYELVEGELGDYDERFRALPRVVALNKVDLVPAAKAAKLAAEWAGRGDHVSAVFPTSAVTGGGVRDLVKSLFRLVPEEGSGSGVGAAEEAGETPLGRDVVAEHRVYRPATHVALRIEREPDGAFRISGRGVERMVERTDLGSEEALERLEARMRSAGIVAALERAGFEAPGEIRIGEVDFEFDPDGD